MQGQQSPAGCMLPPTGGSEILQSSQWSFQNRISMGAKYAYDQRLSHDFILLVVVETWRKNYSLPHTEIWGRGVGGFIPHVTL